MASTQLVSKHTVPDKSSDSHAQIDAAISNGEPYLVATGAHARQFYADLEELRRSRLARAAGSVFKGPRSRFWQIKNQVKGKWRSESTGTEDERTAQRTLAFKRQARDSCLGRRRSSR